MELVCRNCDLGLKRSECTDKEHTECECRKWIIKTIKQDNISCFMHVLDEALESVFENQEDLKMNKIRIINLLSKSIIN